MPESPESSAFGDHEESYRSISAEIISSIAERSWGEARSRCDRLLPEPEGYFFRGLVEIAAEDFAVAEDKFELTRLRFVGYDRFDGAAAASVCHAFALRQLGRQWEAEQELDRAADYYRHLSTEQRIPFEHFRAGQERILRLLTTPTEIPPFKHWDTTYLPDDSLDSPDPGAD